jgi:N-methylhydantoinase B
MLGGLPSLPHGVWLSRSGNEPEYLGAIFSGVQVEQGDSFTRPSAGGGGLGDPLERDPKAVLEDVIDDYVSTERALKDYGVVITEIDKDIDEFEFDEAATQSARARIRGARIGWLQEDPETVAQRYRDGELDTLDLVRQYGVILEWGTGELLPDTTSEYRKMIATRAVSYWSPADDKS